MGAKIVTTAETLGHQPAGGFYLAEEDQRDFYDNNRAQPYCQVIINPKLKKVQAEFATLLKNYQK